ncbi:MAG: hypothetical protein K0R71_294 [Bacillales bacterium]|nr:hypothetical protein [Bacillales bacterium]
MFFGFQNIFEILTILIVLTMYLKKPFAIFATASTGIAVSEVLIRIFIDNTYGISIEQIDSGFSLIAGITLFAFVQFIMKSKGKRSSRRIFL